MDQLDLFEVYDLERLEPVRIADRNDILRVMSVILLSKHAKNAERNKSAELLCRMQGYFKENDSSGAVDESPAPVQIIFNTTDARLKPASD